MGLFFRRSQAALEFLTTYGWAVLVLLVMVASLSNFGILSPDRFLPERCSVGGGFSCDGFEVFEGGLVRVLLVSELGRDLVGGDVSGGVVEGEGFSVDEGVVCDFFDVFGSSLGGGALVRSGGVVIVECLFVNDLFGGVGSKSVVGLDLVFRGLGDRLGSPVAVELFGVVREGGFGSGRVRAASECYDSSNIGEVGEWAGCDSMLIVDNVLLRSGGSSDCYSTCPAYALAGDDSYGVEGPTGEFFSFEDSSRNVFTGQVGSMHALFFNSSFDGDIGYWDTRNVTHFYYIFGFADEFDQDIGNWDTSSATNMFAFFHHASSFNQDIGGWDVSKVVNMQSLAARMKAFDQDISGWDTSSAVNMKWMFVGTPDFDRDLSMWDVSSVTQCHAFGGGSNGLSSENLPAFPITC